MDLYQELHNQLVKAFIAEWTRAMGDPALHKRFRGRVITEAFEELAPEIVTAVFEKLNLTQPKT